MSAVQIQAAVTIQRHVRGLLTRARFKAFVHNLRAHRHTTNEILSTERGYVKSLDTVINVFYKPLAQSKIVDASVIKSIFANIVEIHGIHVNLLAEMADTPHLLGAAFLKSIPAFRAYRSYVANYTTSLTTYNALLEKKPFLDIIKGCCSKSGLQPSDLPALLNKPVVQLARYKLLLEDLLSKTNPQNKDINNLQNAVALLKKVAEGDAADTSKDDSSSSSSEKSLKSNSSNASLARKLNAISQTPHNLPYKTSFISRSVSSTPTSFSSFNPGDPSVPSYLRPTHTSYARANEGRAKKDHVTYTINNTPTWMPNGNPHSDKIYNTVYNAIPYTQTATNILDRTPSSSTSTSGKTWLPTPATPRSFDGSVPRSASSLSVREDTEFVRTPKKSPSIKPLSSTLTPTSSTKRIPSDSNTPTTTPTKPTPSTPLSTTNPSTPRSTTVTPSKLSTPAKTPSKIPTSTTTTRTSPTKLVSSSSQKTTTTTTTTPIKSVVAAARAAGSNIPSPSKATTPNSSAKSGTPKTPGNVGGASKIPVLKSPRTPAAHTTSEFDTGNGKIEEEVNLESEEVDETMTF